VIENPRGPGAAKGSDKGHFSYRLAFIDPSGLVPVVKEVEWLRRQRPRSTVASTDTSPLFFTLPHNANLSLCISPASTSASNSILHP
jgi:hypothetical protein